ncbi:uncharacterized protein RSE6_02229 [Rhynchosporium secalis]|uniref:Uncharacterized protein n=1 Tax=Rhynchosporium secalis TaxID=38038 RepID=A0A1E1LZS3_RHYSE|nr:uncharacterized protein RSE6_02229 [Rhynchosporium secalis]
MSSPTKRLMWELRDVDCAVRSFRGMATLCLEPNNEDTIAITKIANLSDIYDQQIDVGLTDNRQNQSITICHYEQRFYVNRTHPTAYCFHAWCYEILIQKAERCTESKIYKLSQLLSLGSEVWENRHLHRQQTENTSAEVLRELGDRHQPVSKLLRLPAELRNMVWNYIGLEAAFSANVLVAEETTRLLCALNCSSYQTVSLTQGSRISIKMLTVFGTPYIQSLADGCFSAAIPGAVHYLKFAMGLYLTSLSSSDDQILWDQPDIPDTLCDPDKELFDFKRDISLSYERPKRRQLSYFGYLPLFSDNEYVTDLTVYVSRNGIVGIESHFTKRSRLIGDRNGCPKYFPFHSGEQIAFTWLCIINSDSYAFAAPTVTIQTTFGRIHTFGPYILPPYVMNNKYKWILLDRPGSITGFYFDWQKSPVIMRIGVTRESNSAVTGNPNLEFTACNAPYLPRVGPNAGLFMSVASVSNLRKVEFCRVGTRCTGLKLHYLQAPTAVLGQWQTTAFSQHVSMSHTNGLDTMGIRFKFSKSGDHQVATAISFGADTTDDCNSTYFHLGYFHLGETITWWFSRFDDVLAQYLIMRQSNEAERCVQCKAKYSFYVVIEYNTSALRLSKPMKRYLTFS